MQGFDPVAIWAIIRETLGLWLWPLLALAPVLLLAVTAGALRLRAAAGRWRRPLIAALVGGTIATAISFLLVPGWSHARLSALAAPVDVVIALAMSLLPGAVVAGVIFSLVSITCTRRPRRG